MSYERFTNKSYIEAVKSHLSQEYIRLSLLEDAIEKGDIVYKDAVLDEIIDRKYHLELTNKSPEAISTLTWVIKHIRNFKGK